jgi:hypothetical protein
MVAPRLTINPGVTINAGVTLNGYGNTGITLQFSEQGTGGIEDPSGSFSGTGFTINAGATGGGSGVAMTSLTTYDDNQFNASPYNNGYIWNVAWGASSTPSTTPVAMYYNGTGSNAITFWILDPTDMTYMTALNSGTFNFPAVFTPTTTITSFSN